MYYFNLIKLPFLFLSFLITFISKINATIVIIIKIFIKFFVFDVSFNETTTTGITMHPKLIRQVTIPKDNPKFSWLTRKENEGHMIVEKMAKLMPIRVKEYKGAIY